ncbi:hypothetical protein ACP4OV_031636 [Aristida adscensionis]
MISPHLAHASPSPSRLLRFPTPPRLPRPPPPPRAAAGDGGSASAAAARA